MDEKDWRSRASAVEEVHELLDAVSELARKQLTEKLSDFLKIFSKLLDDSNFKISLTALQIVQKISKYPAFHAPPALESILFGLVSKLGDSKVAIRSLALKIIRDSILNFG